MNNEHIGYYIKNLSDEIKKNINSVLGSFDITMQQSQILMYLLENSDKKCNQKDIEIEFSLKNSTVSGILKRLESKNLISRQIKEGDNRYKIIKVTPKAYELESVIKEKRDETELILIKGLKEEEKNIIVNVLRKMLSNLRGSEKNENC